ncbi:MAG: tetratricopeptide repeat protein, partial [SAR324 cluster bacterium]|nr:tetratricopeptide repeat protein [SAR324 cluster bacterium]
KGYELFLLQTPEAMDQAERLFRKTIELDPNYAMAYVNLGYNRAIQAQSGYVDNLEDALENAAELAHKALQIDDQLPDAYCMLGYVRAGQHRFDEGIRLARRCVELDPNRAKMNAILGQNYVFAGQNDEGIDYMSRALRLNPYPPTWYNEILGSAYLRGGQLEKSIQLLSETLPSVPRDDLWFQTQYRLHLIVAYDKLGRTDAIERLVSEVLTVNPAFRITEFTGFDKSVYKDQDRFEEWVQSLRKAGLPE